MKIRLRLLDLPLGRIGQDGFQQPAFLLPVALQSTVQWKQNDSCIITKGKKAQQVLGVTLKTS